MFRTYTKPLGYAGDYEMVNMMLRNPYEGSSAFAKLLNFALLNTEPVVAHRNRIDFLVEKLRSECARRVSRGKTRVFNLACGPAMEVQRFLRECEESDLAEIDLLDFNPETLEYTRERMQEAKMSGGRETQIRYFQRSVHQLLRAATQGGDDEFANYDVVYCAGLFDYLSQRECKRLVELFCSMIRPGGMQLTVMPCFPISRDSPLAHACTAALAANAAFSPSGSDLPVMLMMRPHPRSIICGSRAWAILR